MTGDRLSDILWRRYMLQPGPIVHLNVTLCFLGKSDKQKKNVISHCEPVLCLIGSFDGRVTGRLAVAISSRKRTPQKPKHISSHSFSLFLLALFLLLLSALDIREKFNFRVKSVYMGTE